MRFILLLTLLFGGRLSAQWGDCWTYDINRHYVSISSPYEDENEEAVSIICFWAEKARAKSCTKDGWQNYELTEIPLSEFMENWCVGMENDGLLVGTAFDQNMFGYEAEQLSYRVSSV